MSEEREAEERLGEVLAKLRAGRHQQALELCTDRVRFGRRWPSRLRIDLGRVVALRSAVGETAAVEALRETLETYLEADIAHAIEEEPVFEAVGTMLDVIRAERRREAMRPARNLLILGALIAVFGAVLSLAGASYELACTKEVDASRADCTITKTWLGVERNRKVVESVHEAFSYRAGSSSNGRRMALRAESSEIDVHPNALSDDDEKAEAFNRFLADAQAVRYREIWNLELIAMIAIVVSLSGLAFIAIAAWKALAAMRKHTPPS